MQPYGLDCEKGSIKLKESKRILCKNLAIDECLIKVEEAYFTSSIRRSLLDQAKDWVRGVSVISPTIIQLLERDILPELISVNEKIKKDLTNINKYISDFIFKNNEILFAIQGPLVQVKQHYQVR